MGNIYISTDAAVSNWQFSKAFKEVIYTLTGMELIEDKITDEDIESFNCQISGIITLFGKKNIMITLSMPRETAMALVAYMTGMQYNEITQADLIDGVAELCNVTSGQIKAKAAISGNQFTTSPPFAIIGEGHSLIQKNKVEGFITKYHLDRLSILARVFFI